MFKKLLFLMALILVSGIISSSARAGLAESYPGDIGIENDPSVVFVENFEEGSIPAVIARWDSYKRSDRMSLVADIPPPSSGLDSLLMTHVGGDGTAVDLYTRLLPGFDQLYCRFYVKIDTACNPIHHFVGMGGYNPPSIWPQGTAGAKPNGSDFFTTAIETYSQEWRWDYYTYWMEMRGFESSPPFYGNSFINDSNFSVNRGQWICVELMVKMNYPTTERNGEQAVWINGQPWFMGGQFVSHLGEGFPNGYWIWDNFYPDIGSPPFEGFRWRTVEDLDINYFWLQFYISTAPNGYISKVWFDDIVIAQEYIGPISTTTEPPGQATNPNPGDAATDVSNIADLTWIVGTGATSHDVYFGTDSTPDAGEFQGNQAATIFDPGIMANDTTYYWRIDEINIYGTTTGNVWSFTTEAEAPVLVDECENWQILHPEWIFCDDFESTDPMVGVGRYFEYDDNGGDFVPVDDIGFNNGRTMRVLWQASETVAGSFKLAFGRTPSGYMDKGISNTEDFRDVYYRFYMKMQDGWQGNPERLSIATIFAASDWSQAMIAHHWSGTTYNLANDPVSCVDASSQVVCIGFNDTPNYEWLGGVQGITEIFDSDNDDIWHCVEVHVKLNDPGMANGIQECWIDGVLDARADNLDFVTSYQDYGINAIIIENYWGAGSPQLQERYIDSFVVSTQPIGQRAAATMIATNPSPADSATDVSIDADLSWTPGFDATSHDVYFGTTSPGSFQGNQASATFDPGTMANDTTYYWRIDEVDTEGTTTGTVWSFTTIAAGGQVTEEFGDAVNTDHPGTIEDTYNSQGSGTNYSTELTLNTYTWPKDTIANTTIIEWDLSSIPTTATVIDATLYLYQVDNRGASYDIGVHKIINVNPVISACTWNTYDGTNSWTGGADGGQSDIAAAEDTQAVNDTDNEYKTWSVTNMVADWVATPANNYGMLVNSDSVAKRDDYRFFASTEAADSSTRPKLVVTYSTGAAPPGQASNPSPADSATDISVTADLSWTEGADSTSSDVYFGTTSPGTYQGNQTATTFDPGTMSNDTTYYWRIDEINTAGTTTGTVWSFTTIAAGGTGTGLTGDYYDNMDFTSYVLTRVDPTVNFDWASGSPDPAIGADTFSVRWTGEVEPLYSETYTFYTVSDDGVRLWVNSQLLVDAWVDQSPTEYSGTIALTAGVKYDIQMDYYENAGGAVAQLLWSSASQAKVIIPQSQLYEATGPTPPGQASNPNPTNGATDISVDADLSWTAGSGATSHDVYFGTSSPGTFQGNQTATTFEPGTLANDTTYYWRIDEVNAAATTTGNVWSFTTESIPAPGQASNPSPSNGATDVSIDADLSWTAGSGATSHDVYFGTSSPGTFQGNQAATTFEPGTLANDITYYWRIDEVNVGGTTTGTVWSFTTIVAAPGAASSPSPADSAADVSITADLSWSAGTGATSHDVYFGTSSPGAFQGNQTATTFDPGTMGYSTTYYWRINEVNAGGTTTGTVWSFTTEAAPPPPPGQASNPNPADSATDVGVGADLSWTAGSNTTSHDVYFGTSSPGTFQGNQTATTFDPGTMDNDTTYYWRIDEINASGTTTGVVWSFTTVTAGGPVTEEFGDAVNTDYPGTIEDTYTNAGGSGNNYSTDPTLNTYTWPADTVANTTIIKWNLSAIPTSATVTEATLYLYQTDSGGDSFYDLPVHKIVNVNPVISACTWNTYDGTNSWTGGADGGQSDTAAAEDTPAVNNTINEYKTWTVTDMVADWVATPSSNYGMLVNSDAVASMDSFRFFASTEDSDSSIRPKLIVTYSTGVAPPGQASNPSPADSATDVSINADLSWTEGSDSTSSDVYFGTTSPGAFQGNQTATTFDPGTLSNDTTYYWRIDEINAAGTTTGNVWSFTTIVAAPGQASNPSPADSATDVSIDADLSWTAGSGSTSSDVYFGTDSTPDSGEFQGNQTATTYDPGTLANGATYYWRIDEINAAGTTTGAVWSFTTIVAVPGQASNPSPADTATDIAVSADLSWTAGNGSTSSDVYFGTTSPGTFQGNQTATTFDPGTMTNDTTYYWRIDEINAGGTTTGAVWSFTTVTGGQVVEEFGDATNTDYPGTIEDTYNNQGSGTNYSTELTLNTYTWPADTVANTTIIKWDLSSIPTSATVTDATLYLYQVQTGGDASYDLPVHKIINVNPVISACSWNTYDGTNSWTGGANGGQSDIAAAEDTPAVNNTINEYKTWSVTNMVADWVTTPANNYGMLVNSDAVASMDSWRFFASTEDSDSSIRPKLIVTYSSAPAGDVEIIGSWVSGTSHTEESGTNRLLVFNAHVEDNDTDMNLTSVTYGGQSMTKVVEQNVGSGYRAYVVAYVLDEAGINAASGSDFVPTWAQTPSRTPGYSSVFLQNVSQTASTGATDGNGTESSATLATSALSTNDGDMVFVAGTCGNSGTYSVNNGFTEGIEITISSADGVAGYKAATGANETPSITHSNVNRQVVIGFVVQAE
jgi:hypothetical protein